MGNYPVLRRRLVEALRKDAADESSKHDMGGNIMPMMVDRGMAQVYDFQRNEVPGADPADAGYWRDPLDVGPPTTTRTWTLRYERRYSTCTTVSGRSCPTSRRTHRRSRARGRRPSRPCG